MDSRIIVASVLRVFVSTVETTPFLSESRSKPAKAPSIPPTGPNWPESHPRRVMRARRHKAAVRRERYLREWQFVASGYFEVLVRDLDLPEIQEI